MKKIWTGFVRYFIYGGVKKEEYRSIREDIRKYNLSVWRVLSLIEVGIFLACFISSYYSDTVKGNKILYLTMLILSIISFVSFLFAGKKAPKFFIDALMYVAVIMLLIYGTVTALSSANELAVTFMVLLVVAPMLITGRPFITVGMILVAAITFALLAFRFKSGSVRSVDLFNALAVSVVSICLHLFMTINKIKGLLARHQLSELTYRDGLTGLENELSYVIEVERVNHTIKDGKQGKFAVMMCDVNGVKPTNDTYGHQFGCALIVEGGHYLASLLPHSRVFHFGGDEYIIELEGEDYERREELAKEFEEKMDHYFIEKDGVQLRVSIAYGVSCYQKGKDDCFETVMQRADKAMYEKKRYMKAKYHIASRKEEDA